MRRIAGHLFAVCSITSLALCVVVCVLWARSRRGWDETPVIVVGGRWAQAYSYHGAAHLFWSRSTPPPGTLLRDEWDKTTGAKPTKGLLGFAPSLCFQWPTVSSQDLSTDPEIGVGYTYVHLPLWLLAAPGAVLPALWARDLVRRRHRVRMGLCPSCGYDLRASPGRCPECGAVAGAGATTTV